MKQVKKKKSGNHAKNKARCSKKQLVQKQAMQRNKATPFAWFGSYFCCDELPQIQWFKMTWRYILEFWRMQVKNLLQGENGNTGKDVLPRELWGQTWPLSFLACGGCLGSLAQGSHPAIISLQPLLLSSHFLLPLWLSCLSYKDLSDYTGPLSWSRIGFHLKIFNILMSAKSLLLDKVTNSQVLGMRLGTFLQDYYSACLLPYLKDYYVKEG